MTYILEGAYGQDWQAANWVFRNMSAELLKALREMPEAEKLAERLQEAIEIEVGHMDASDLLASPEQSAVWSAAVDRTVVKLRAEGSTHWNQPDRFEPFLAKVQELKNLAVVQQPA